MHFHRNSLKWPHGQIYSSELRRRKTEEKANCLFLYRYLLCHCTSREYCSSGAAIFPLKKIRRRGGSQKWALHIQVNVCILHRNGKTVQVFYFPEFLRTSMLNTIRHSNLIKKKIYKIDLLCILQKKISNT